MFFRITIKSAERFRNDEATINNIQIKIKRLYVVFVIEQEGCLMLIVIFVEFKVC